MKDIQKLTIAMGGIIILPALKLLVCHTKIRDTIVNLKVRDRVVSLGLGVS